jgi:hypothetical protein
VRPAVFESSGRSHLQLLEPLRLEAVEDGQDFVSGRCGCASPECDMQLKEAAVIAEDEHVARAAALVVCVLDELEVGRTDGKARCSWRPERGVGWVFPAVDEGAGCGKVMTKSARRNGLLLVPDRPSREPRATQFPLGARYCRSRREW